MELDSTDFETIRQYFLYLFNVIFFCISDIVILLSFLSYNLMISLTLAQIQLSKGEPKHNSVYTLGILYDIEFCNMIIWNQYKLLLYKSGLQEKKMSYKNKNCFFFFLKAIKLG